MDPVQLENLLARYIEVLSTSATDTSRAEDRPRYEHHLAEAARMFSVLRLGKNLDALKRIVADERRSFGWSYLSGDSGKAAERAFDDFAKQVEGTS